MAYNIKHLDNVNLQKRLYFFDANMWLKILKPPFNVPPRDQKYLEFFEKFKGNPNKPRVALTALVLSEVINRYLRDVTYKIFCKKKGNPNPDISYYKQVYRADPQFQSDYISLCEDIKAYSQYYELVSDGLSIDIKQKDLLTSPPVQLDFNDLYFYKLAIKRQYPIVTDDKDFFVEDVEILTFNNQLLDRAKSMIKPTAS